MKILSINYEFPPLGGGGGRALAKISACMSKDHHEVSIITSKFKDLPKQELLDGYKVIRIPSFRKHKEKCSIFEMTIFMFFSFFFVLSKVRKQKPDIIISFFTIPSSVSALLNYFIFRTPYIVSLRGGDVPGFMEEQIAFYHRLLLPLTKLIWKKAKYVVANSQGLQQLALKTLPDLDIKIIPNGIDLKKFYQLPKEKEDFITLLTVGRLSPQKDIPTILRSLDLLNQKGLKKFKLQIVGDGDERKKIEELILNSNLENQVELLGWIDQSKINLIYQKADVFILASLYEGMPNVVLEAMASGLPIVGTNIAGTEELVDHQKNGFLFEKMDHLQLAQYLEQLIDNEDLRDQMREQSLEKIKNYSWDRVSQEYLSLCQN